MRTGVRAAVWALALAAGGALTAQQRPVFRAGVETVQIDVAVRDRSGRPVHGLSADDFIILDRGKPQPVVTFKAVRREPDASPSFASHFPATTRLDVSNNGTAMAGTIAVIVLDDLHAYRGRDDVVKSVARSVVQQLAPDALMALLMTSGDYNVDITHDRSRVLAGIDRFRGVRLVRRPMQANDDRRGPADLQEFDANLRLYSTLESAARLFGGADGRRKAFVLISENLSKDLGGVLGAYTPAADEVRGGEAYAEGNLEAMNPRAPTGFHDLAVLDAIKSLRKSNVVTYALDPRGQVSTRNLLLECQPSLGFDRDPCTGDENAAGPPSLTSWVRLAQNGLRQFTEASGGFAVVDSSDFAAGVANIIDDLDNYYLLGFNTDDPKTPGVRRLEVQVKDRRDLLLRYRRGYEITDPAKAASAPADAMTRLAAGALPSAGLPLRLTATALPGTGGQARIPLTFEVSMPRARIELPGGRLEDQIRYGVTVVDMRSQKVRETSSYDARLDMRPGATAGAPPDVVTYQVYVETSLPPGRYQLRAYVWSSRVADGGSVYLPLEVPDFGSARVAVSAPLLGYGAGPRVPVVRGGAEPGPPALPLVPTLDREFLVTDDVVLYFEVIRQDRTRDVALEITAVDGQDQVIRRFDRRVPISSAGKVSVRIPLEEFGAGAFRLRVHASNGVSEATSEVPIVVR